MKFYNINEHNEVISFKQAVIKGLGKQKGLFFPAEIPYYNNINFNQTFEELALNTIKPFVGDDLSESQLQKIISATCSFDFPLFEIEPNTFIVELFYGPTLAFKDIGAKFMAQCLEIFSTDENKKTRILVATSGDTGSAVAAGFHNVENIEVIILYPKGKVSEIQELQLTTFGDNIRALAVEGSFDDCQALVKEAFSDEIIYEKYNYTSANSINVARWLPQTLYYLKTVQTLVLKGFENVSFSVPSGNFGNICAGIILQKMGFPIRSFIAATNMNDTIPRYFETQKINPNPTVPTLSNAMDVSIPSNFVRILELFDNDFAKLSQSVMSKSFSEQNTIETIQTLYKKHNYIACPHTAIGFAGLALIHNNNNEAKVSLSTAHPVKFTDSVENIIHAKVPEPTIMKDLRLKEKQVKTISNRYNDLRKILLE